MKKSFKILLAGFAIIMPSVGAFGLMTPTVANADITGSEIDPGFSRPTISNPSIDIPTVDKDWVNVPITSVVIVKDGLSASVFDYNGHAIGEVAPQNTAWFTDQQHTNQNDGKVYYRIATDKYILADQVNI
ncbi:SLAP domain-containing protein [Lactobacillus terrae]|uniref:SLAP domain-containing protein n=1 Tax=Lactobacillus terrae TaxID=2269374 RepID=UPI000C1B72AD|nr:SLAP domain-containing protein [Lactobacillus terrae]